jgi:hypothetical protein
MTTLGWWVFCGKPVGASETNDLGLARKDKEELKAIMDSRDIIVSNR